MTTITACNVATMWKVAFHGVSRSRRALQLSIRASSSSWNWNDTSKATPKDKQTNEAAIPPTTPNAEMQAQVMDQCAALHSSIMPLNEKLRGPLAKNSDKGTSLPFVFLVGNHSSGKSSFINYVMGRNVQTAGVAPTDDTFTVIAPGPEDTDQDGPAMIGDSELGFGNLRQFGPTLIHHAQLKIRTNIASSNFMLVDSPGMIDSPVVQSLSAQQMDRGYDFQGVVKWFAERADVVLLFFDPDKPGTTGETLSVLLHSLAGMDHKLLIVLNKADQFKKIHDFARAYGSLCWNLSKVIPRKDLPRIYTMCLPVKESSSSSSSLEASASTDSIGSSGLADLHQTRHDVVAQVMKAPKRRIDNTITHLTDSVHLLLMHATLVQETNRLYMQRIWEHRMQQGGCLVTGMGLTALGIYTNLPMEFTGGVVAATVLGVGGLTWFNTTKMKAVERQLVSPEELSASFQRTHAREISEADEFTTSIWQRIRDPLRLSLQSIGLANMPTVHQNDLDALNRILNEDIPRLRQVASPTHFGSANSKQTKT